MSTIAKVLESSVDMKPDLSIVIPTYNGQKLLEEFLPSVITYCHGAEIIVVDDASNDETASFMKTHYPGIKLIVNRFNRGFSYSVNRGFKKAKTKYVLLLNNDVELQANTIPHLLDTIKQDENIFGVGAKEILPDSSNRGCGLAQFSRGLLVHRGDKSSKCRTTLWVFGASGLFRRDLWLELSGLDELYRPAYWEDIDLGYRAWKKGYRCLYQPEASVLHQCETTMNEVLKGRKARIVYRNQLLFFWKNITSTRLWLEHFTWLPYHLLVTSWRSRGDFLFGFFMALGRSHEIKRGKTIPCSITDQQIISRINQSTC